jgi:hypothetical protein
LKEFDPIILDKYLSNPNCPDCLDVAYVYLTMNNDDNLKP